MDGAAKRTHPLKEAEETSEGVIRRPFQLQRIEPHSGMKGKKDVLPAIERYERYSLVVLSPVIRHIREGSLGATTTESGNNEGYSHLLVRPMAPREGSWPEESASLYEDTEGR